MARLAFILAVLLVSAGCTGPQKKDNQCVADCEDNTTKHTPPISPTPTPGVGVTDLLNQTVAFSNCQGVGGLTALLYEDVRPLVPDDFRLMGLVPETVLATVNSYLCERIVVEATVYPNVYYFATYVLVTPKNETRDGKGIDLYLLDQRTSSEEVSGFINSIGMTIETAEFLVTNTSLPGQAVLQNWEVSASRSKFLIDIITASEAEVGGGPMSYWMGEEKLRRVDFDQRYQYLTPRDQADTLRSEGNSKTRSAFGEDHPMDTYVLSRLNMTWIVDPRNVFESEGG